MNDKQFDSIFNRYDYELIKLDIKEGITFKEFKAQCISKLDPHKLFDLLTALNKYIKFYKLRNLLKRKANKNINISLLNTLEILFFTILVESSYEEENFDFYKYLIDKVKISNKSITKQEIIKLKTEFDRFSATNKLRKFLKSSPKLDNLWLKACFISNKKVKKDKGLEGLLYLLNRVDYYKAQIRLETTSLEKQLLALIGDVYLKNNISEDLKPEIQNDVNKLFQKIKEFKDPKLTNKLGANLYNIRSEFVHKGNFEDNNGLMAFEGYVTNMEHIDLLRFYLRTLLNSLELPVDLSIYPKRGISNSDKVVLRINTKR